MDHWTINIAPLYFISYYQGVDGEGLQFDNLTTKGSFPPINYLIMLIVDIVLYFLLALYLDAVVPAEYGQRKPPHFIFMPSFWRFVLQQGKESSC